MAQEIVTATDGTPIAYQRGGEGPPLVLVHGTSADHTRWKPVLPTFEEHFSVCTIDRRGRGASGDSEEYSIEREFEDVAAVVDSFEEPAYLLGHSYGALCALGATPLTSNVRKLVLYEPPVEAVGEQTDRSGIVERLEALLKAGHHAAGGRRGAFGGGGAHAHVARLASASGRCPHDTARTASAGGLSVRARAVRKPPGANTTS
jgi:pimeloyl-ACP methyl ester carboxylesterase